MFIAASKKLGEAPMISRLSLYSRLPIWAQNLALSRVAAKAARWRYSGQFAKYFSQSLEREKWNQERVDDYRRAKLKAYLELAYERSSYYRGLFNERDVNPTYDDPDEALASLPVLTKDLIREHRDQLVIPSEAKGAKIAHSSGTTGSSLMFPVTRESTHATWAIWWRYRLRFGILAQTPMAAFHAPTILIPPGQNHPPFWRRIKNRWEDQWFFSIYHLRPETARIYVDHLRSTQVTWLDGHPSFLAKLASYIIEQNLDPGDNIRVVTLGTETIFSFQADIIRKAFAAEVRQHYGVAEGVANFSECEHGQIHVDEDFTTVEFEPVDGDVCRVLGTGVNNAAFLFIRYDTGDIARVRPTGCECGKPGRIVESIDGRREDYIVLPNGTMVGRLQQPFEVMVNIREAQLIQDTRDRLTVKIVRLVGYGPGDERRLLSRIRSHIGSEIKIDLKYVESIPRTESGKLRFVVSNLPGAGIESVSR